MTSDLTDEAKNLLVISANFERGTAQAAAYKVELSSAGPVFTRLELGDNKLGDLATEGLVLAGVKKLASAPLANEFADENVHVAVVADGADAAQKLRLSKEIDTVLEEVVQGRQENVNKHASYVKSLPEGERGSAVDAILKKSAKPVAEKVTTAVDFGGMSLDKLTELATMAFAQISAGRPR